MCGIAGFEREAGRTQTRAEVLTRRLTHRGPDGHWSEDVGNWTLVQTRLAVIDLSPQVRYPLPSEDGRLWLLFNGEVYNHLDLRRELEACGHRFATRCDAEVVLHGYEQWGDRVFARLNGMWATALVDAESDELVLARDPRGIKPMVRTSGDGPFGFASDAFALVAAGLSAGHPDREAIAEYVAFHYVPAPRTGIADIAQVEPGTIVRRSRDGCEVTTRWAPPVFANQQGRNAQVSLSEARDVVHAAVSRQLKADVSVGIFLSGGIDSALLLKCALEAGARPVAFTLAFPDAGAYDESAAAASVAAALGVDHRVEALRADFSETVECISRTFDTPLADPSAIATLPLAQLARTEVKVALTGTGGDDLFAGYYRHRAVRLRRLANAVPPAVRRQLQRASTRRGGERRNWMTLLSSYLLRMMDARSSDDRSLYLSLVGASTSPQAATLLYDSTDLWDARERVAGRHGLPHGDLTLDEIQDFELSTYLSGDLLVKEDRATMAFGLEGRVPFLDGEVVDLARRTPPSQRASLRAGKVLLRQLARRELGPRLAATRKRGFAVPLGMLFQKGWGGEAAEWLRGCDSDFVDVTSAGTMVRENRLLPLDAWALVALVAWETELGRLRRGTHEAGTSRRLSGGRT